MARANTEKFAADGPGEIVFSNASTSRQVNYAVRTGRLRAIARGLYTSNLVQPLEAIVRQNLWRIVAGYLPGAVIVDRTALEYLPANDGSVFLSAAAPRVIELPGLIIRARAGAGPVAGDSPWMGEELFMSSPARAALENLRPSRARSGARRTLTRSELEEWLDRQASSGPGRLNEIRDAARAIAPLIGAERELVALDELLGAMQGTRDAPMASPLGAARKRGLPLDAARLTLFEELHAHLLAHPLPRLITNQTHDASVFAFYEAYFSNFIEGTEFTVDEAEEIVFEGVIPSQRPVDAHDIAGTYRLVADPIERRRTPADPDAFIGLLRDQHRAMLAERTAVDPGRFKERANHAGSTLFVEPARVEGTLREAHRRFYGTTEPGLARAALMMFIVSEVHPFVDGNGRLARIVLNAELSAQGEQRIIVSVRDRDDHLQALRGLTHNRHAAGYLAMLAKLQRDSWATDCSSRPAARASLAARHAFDEEPSGPSLGDLLGR